MSKDIRSFFLPKGKKSDQSSKTDRHEIISKKSKKRAVVIDSDSDEIIEITPKKKKNVDKDVADKKSSTAPVKLAVKNKTEKLKLVDLAEMFGNESFKRSTPPKNLKPKNNADCNFKEKERIYSDDEFEATLSQIDEIESKLKYGQRSSTSEVTHVSNVAEETEATRSKSSVNKDKHRVNSLNLEKNRDKSQTIKTPSKQSPEGLVVKQHNTVKKDNPMSKAQDYESIESPSTSKHVTSPNTSVSSPVDPLEKKRQQAVSYMKYLQRGGPKNPGSKEIPEGKPGCLAGLVFVITGVLDSLERAEVEAIIKKYGGKVTSNVSRNTSYLICGDEPGQSKLTKAETMGTPQIDEDGFLKLIVSQSNDSRAQIKDETPKKAKKRPQGKTEGSETPKQSKLEKSKDVENSGGDKFNKTPELNGKVKYTNKTSGLTHKSFEKSSTNEQFTNNSISQTTSQSSVGFTSCKSLLWVDKYKPTKTKQIIGQQGDRSALKKLTAWLQNWYENHSGNKKHAKPSPWAKNDDGAYFKAALLSGPPGIGKTTMAHLVSNELGFDIVEFNASDTRSKKLLHQEITELLSSKSLVGYFISSSGNHQTSSKHVLIMDEVDGMAGNEDRGGVQELIQLIKSTRIPIICMCNDRNHPKIRSLANYCYDLRVMKPRLEQIKGAMMSVCYKEGLKIPADSLNDIICGTNYDVRQILHSLSLWAAKAKHSPLDLHRSSTKPPKDLKMGPWDVAKKVFSIDDHKNMSIHDKSDLFFHDYSINPLFVQENYLSVTPAVAKGSITKTLQCIADTANSISWGDVVEKCIRSRGAWSLLPVQAMYSSVIPGDIMEGYMRGQINFPAWLGKNSRAGKFDRLLQELHVHSRLSISGSKQALNLEYLPQIRDAIIHPLVTEGSSGVATSLEVLQSYNLLREDLESILELTMWPNQKDPMSAVESKVKAALTRAYNKEGIITPYSVINVVKKRSPGVSSDGLEDADGGEEEEEECPDDIRGDAMIKTKKTVKGDEVSGKVSRGRGKNSSDSNPKGSQKKGRGKGK